MSARRYVIDVWDLHQNPKHQYVRTLDLPDAEHIHLTRRADGGWDAVPMEWTRIDIEDPTNNRWRNVPAEPEDGARD